MKQRWFGFLMIAALVVGMVGVAPLGALARPQAAAFTAGNVVVYRVGTGASALAATGTAVFLDEYNSATGALVQSIPMPTTASGSQMALVASGTATSEGLLTLSEDRNYLVVTGDNAAVGATVIGQQGNTVNRVIGRVDASGAVDTSTGLSNAAFTGNIRSAASDDGSQFWVTGSNVGMLYAVFGAVTSSPVTVFSGTTNLRQVKIGKGQLYVTTGSGSAFRLGTVGSGKPTTSGQTVTSLPGLPTAAPSAPYSFFLADLDAGVAGYDTLYWANNGTGAIDKYSVVSGSWTLNGSITLAGITGLTGSHSGSTVTLNGTTPTSLIQFADSAGYNAAPSTTIPTWSATAATNTAFRGVAFAPGTSPTAITLTTLNGRTSTDTAWIVVLPLAALALLIGGWMLRRRAQL